MGFGERVRAGWRAFRRWRRTRPFWAGLFTLLAGFNFLSPPSVPLRLGTMLIQTKLIMDSNALLIGGALVVCGVLLWIRPVFRFVAGVAALILSLVGLVTANLGALLVGTILGLIGGALAVAWTYRPPDVKPAKAPPKDKPLPGTPPGPNATPEPTG